jgi:hypothetical protein
MNEAAGNPFKPLFEFDNVTHLKIYVMYSERETAKRYSHADGAHAGGNGCKTQDGNQLGGAHGARRDDHNATDGALDQLCCSGGRR